STTNSDGIAQYSYEALLMPNTYKYKAVFEEELPYLASSGEANLTVKAIPTNLMPEDVSVYFGDIAELKARVMRPDFGSGISDKNIKFYVDENNNGIYESSEYKGTSTTNSDGIAQYSYEALLMPNTYKYKAVFEEELPYLASSGAAKLAIKDLINTPGRIVGWGSIADNKTIQSFNFNVLYQTGGLRPIGTFVHLEYGTNRRYFSNSINHLMVSPDKKRAIFDGNIIINSIPGYKFYVIANDNGNPGVFDKYHIRIFKPDGSLYYKAQGNLFTGNIQIYP
ncbi:MAG: hypothetical protein HY776_06660, partial [Actinobacteria bacterium]|nr:hypothetical protein [Actinomycetota bacterium]